MMEKTIMLPDGTNVPSIGQGTWYLGEKPNLISTEEAAIRTGIECGMTLIDTAEMYGNGKSEILVGNAIKGENRDKLFIVSKVYPWNAGEDHIYQSCDNSLRRLGTDYLDLYLLHWRGGVPLAETVGCMESLVKMGKIRRWGVSNFDTPDIQELFEIENGRNCAVNQVLYHIASRGIEYELLPWMRIHGVPLMAYSPLAQAGELRNGILSNHILKEIAAHHQASVAEIMLAFVIRDGDVIAVPRSGNPAHTKENAKAAKITLSAEELELIDKEFPAPLKKMPLDMI